jgi:hypothetical protein
MAVSGEQRRALRLLAGSPLGATEAIMLAHAFTNAMLDGAFRVQQLTPLEVILPSLDLQSMPSCNPPSLCLFHNIQRRHF